MRNRRHSTNGDGVRDEDINLGMEGSSFDDEYHKHASEEYQDIQSLNNSSN